MIKANFNAYSSYVADSLYQWDKDQILEISGLNISVSPEIHFTNIEMDRAIVRQGKLHKNTVSVKIPNSMLQSIHDIRVYIGVYEGALFKTIETVIIPIIERNKPEGYTLTVNDEEYYSFSKLENKIANMVTLNTYNNYVAKMDNEILARENALKKQIANIIAHNEDTSNNTELIDLRIDSDGNVYESAGESVRGQIKKVKKDFSTIMVDISNNLNDEKYENGRFNSSGEEYVDSTCFRSVNYIPVIGGMKICAFYDRKDGLRHDSIRIIEYNSDRSVIKGPNILNCMPAFTVNDKDNSNKAWLKLDDNTSFIRFDNLSGVGHSILGDNALVSIYYVDKRKSEYQPYVFEKINAEEVYDKNGISLDEIIRSTSKKILSVEKSISILGDSYSTYGGWIPNEYKPWYSDTGNSLENDVESVEDTWWYKLCKEKKLRLVINSSWSGATISYTGYNEKAKQASFITRMKSDMGEKRTLCEKPDAILIYGGINDNLVPSPLGELKFSDWIEDDFYKTLPAFCYMLDYIIKYNPQARIIVMIPSSIGVDYKNGMKQACEHYGVINVEIVVSSTQGGHPNKQGMVEIFEQVIELF